MTISYVLSSKRKAFEKSLFNFEVTDLDVTGIYGDEVTPVPIPNTEVKLISVENTWLATAWEDRAMPVQNEPPPVWLNRWEGVFRILCILRNKWAYGILKKIIV